ncbi:MAG: hypothetical protein JWM95_1503, partial [Gemmatimonadetes bacterium]|nr:hypothetical protein [Gemmatimonadota bacterium]
HTAGGRMSARGAAVHAQCVMSLPSDTDVAVIGGGFYGLRIGGMAARSGLRTILLEQHAHFLGRASFVNQARIHGGYHYPRSVLTAIRARELYARFRQEFAEAVGAEFQHVYAIARQQTLVGAREFAEFCRRIDAPLSPAPRALAAQFDSNTVEQTFLADEGVFDAHRLADMALEAALSAGVECAPHVTAVAVAPGAHRRLRLSWRQNDVTGTTEADWVVNASYAALNQVPANSGLQPIPLIHELAELSIVQPPPSMLGMGVTVMDGPFWSCIPFPALRAHSLSHVRYTPHARWHSDDTATTEKMRLMPASEQRESHAALMQRDAARFLPAMRDARHHTSLWEIKTVLPRSSGDDGRPILVHRHDDAPGFISILGAKIDSVYDVEDELRELIVS